MSVTSYNRTQTTTNYVFDLVLNRVHDGEQFHDAWFNVLSKVDPELYTHYLGGDETLNLDTVGDYLLDYYGDPKNWR